MGAIVDSLNFDDEPNDCEPSIFMYLQSITHQIQMHLRLTSDQDGSVLLVTASPNT